MLDARLRDRSRQTTDRPTLIIVDSHIGYGAPNKQDTHAAHGEPLGEEEIRLTKQVYGWPEDAKFLVPDGVCEHFAERHRRARRASCARRGWRSSSATRRKYPEARRRSSIADAAAASCPTGWDKDLPTFPADAKGIAGRDASGKVLNAIAQNVPWLIGGSADLAPSTKTRLTFEGAGDFDGRRRRGGRNFHFGVREHAMGAILNGMALSKVRPYGSAS